VSIMIMSRVFRMNLGGVSRKLLAVRLADFADDEGRGIYPGIKRLAAETELSERTIQRILGDFVDDGILVVVKEASGRPGQATRYDFDLTALFGYIPGKTGDSLSPVNTSRGVTNKTETGDTDDRDGCHGVTRTVIEPLVEPLSERDAREGVREGEEGQASEPVETPAAIERAFRKFFFGWKTSISDSEIDARKEWFALCAQDRSDGFERSPEYQDQALTTGRKYLCSAAKYLRERRWTKLAAPKRTEGGPVPSKPFSRPWCALRLAELLKPMANLPAFPPFVRKMIEDGKLDAEAQKRDRIAQHGWPAVNELHARASNFPPKGSLVPPDIASIAEGFTGFKVGGSVYEAWRRLHEARQWPFLPSPGKLEYVQFPAIPDGAPDDVDDAVAAALKAFEQSLRGVRGDEYAA
jgi:hypothetical protein